MSISKPSIKDLVDAGLNGRTLDKNDYLQILSNETSLIDLVQAVYPLRKKHFDNKVTIHILNNVQNGHCPEDCSYCAQGKASEAAIEKYPMKPDEEVIAEAKSAHERGAHRYCMVFSGRGPSNIRVKKMADLIKKIKTEVPIEVCLSAGFISNDHAKTLKKAGLDRLNHNLNTSSSLYKSICSTHTYEDRVNTLKAAKSADLDLCSGVIVGMGESQSDIVDLAFELKELNPASIPVNFLIPIPGNTVPLSKQSPLTPEYCVRILALFRLILPEAELRAAAGREGHLRSLEPLSYYVANSIFLDGYLNTKGSNAQKTLEMLKDNGFEIESEIDISDLIIKDSSYQVEGSSDILKNADELRPTLA